MVSLLLYHLPPTENYRILFMERDLDEMLISQEKMLERLGRKAAPRDEIKRSYTTHLERLHEWLGHQDSMKILHVRYKQVLDQPASEAQRVAAFLDRQLDSQAMVRAVDPALYRNRKT
jgi:hypothetical protein